MKPSAFCAKFNEIHAHFQFMDSTAIRSAYSSVELFTFAVNKTLATQPKFSCDGAKFASLLRNRSINLTIGETWIDKDGIGEVDLNVMGFDERAKKLKVWSRKFNESLGQVEISFQTDSLDLFGVNRQLRFYNRQ